VTLSPTLLSCWQEALRRRRNSTLRWVLAGTGDMSPESERPRNTGIVLDARSGEVLGHQDKLYPFNMSSDILSRWNLTPRLGETAIAEDIAVHPRRLSIFEAGAMRFAILICEDLGRLIDLGPVIRDMGVTHLFVPVLARPLKRHHWEQSAASVYARDTGATVVVSNSLAMGALDENGTPGTALMLAHDGSVTIDSAKDPAEPVVFHLEL
jgi:predicted amidohydrolase